MKKLLLLSSLAIFFNSCSDSRYEGCTDPQAINYKSFADYDDGSCDYIADVVFFYDAITANELNSWTDIIYGDIDRLDYYIEEQFVGSEYPGGNGFVYAGIPNCYEATYVTEELLWGNNNNTLVNYRVEGIHIALLANLITIIDEDSFVLGANQCAAVQAYFISKKK
tara:strand:- start:88 stop:588 length:501 start_codon:yes stop_codon:yes gene_type:complete